ncbi:hypothetical protein Tco_1008523 [Tanacetum coccineum]
MLLNHKLIADIEDGHHRPSDANAQPSHPFEFLLKKHEHLKMEMEIPSVKASANSDIIFFFTSAQDGNKLLDDERLSLADDLKKAHDQNQNKSK